MKDDDDDIFSGYVTAPGVLDASEDDKLLLNLLESMPNSLNHTKSKPQSNTENSDIDKSKKGTARYI